MIESSKYGMNFRELPGGVRQYLEHMEWTHEGSPNLLVGVDGIPAVTGETYDSMYMVAF